MGFGAYTYFIGDVTLNGHCEAMVDLNHNGHIKLGVIVDWHQLTWTANANDNRSAIAGNRFSGVDY